MGYIYILTALPILIAAMIALTQQGRRWNGVFPLILQIIFPLEIVLALIIIIYGSLIIYNVNRLSPEVIRIIIISLALGAPMLGLGVAGGSLFAKFVVGDSPRSTCELHYQKIWDSSTLLDESI